mmetsp:Transcript_47253/g.117969  ORF Transcript_47253/g.117969 Transcript_47253/m.117969 type:complete len:243 (-) Transcript_47253:14-742(-)
MHLCFEQVEDGLLSDGEVVGETFLQILQGQRGLVLLVIQLGQKEVAVSVGGVELQTLQQYPLRSVVILQCDPRLRQEYLSWNEPRHKSGERLQDFDAPRQALRWLLPSRTRGSGLLLLLWDGGRGSGSGCLLQVLPGYLEHKVGIQLDEELVPTRSSESGDVQGECVVEVLDGRLAVVPLAPGDQRRHQGQLCRLANTTLYLVQEVQLFLSLREVALLDAAVEDAQQRTDVGVVLLYRLLHD